MRIPVTALVAAAVVAAGCNIRVGDGRGPVERPGPLVEESETVELTQAEIVQVELQLGAGKIEVEGGADNLMEADFRYNIPSWKPEIHFEETGFRGRLTVKQGSGSAIMGKATNEWRVRLSDKAPIDLEVTCGAGDGRLDLRGMNLRSVNVKMGAGRVDLDLRSEYQRDFDVNMEGGVGDATIHLPRGLPVEAQARGGIGKIDVRGLTKEEDNLWVSAGSGSDRPAIRLNVKGGVGAIKIYAD
ncbi:MAG: hypothetical protein KJZ84_04340 [Bryobacteraceae bacterium]|nr:hypothetical protein [Bryobacteraceae bacterium]